MLKAWRLEKWRPDKKRTPIPRPKRSAIANKMLEKRLKKNNGVR